MFSVRMGAEGGGSWCTPFTAAPFEAPAKPAEEEAAKPAVAAPVEATPVAPLTLEVALDFVYTALAAGEAEVLPHLEHEMAVRALRTTEGDEAKAAKILGVAKATLHKKLKQG